MSDTYQDLANTTFPDNLDKYKIYQDVNLDNVTYIEQIQSDVAAHNFDGAKTILAAHPELNNVIATAALFQRYEDQIIAVERTWASSIYDKVTHVVSYKGDYSNTATYQMFNVVNYNNKSYQCISTDDITGVLPTNTENWSLLTIQGISGTGMAFYSSWTSTQEYKVQDCVPYGNKLWVCITANTNQEPDTSPDYWKQIIVVPRQIIWSKNQPENQEENDIWNQTSENNNSYITHVCQGNNSYVTKEPTSEAQFISTSDGSNVQTKLDEDNKISTYVHSYDSATKIHNLQGTGSNIKFLATADYHDGDTWTVNGQTVTASMQDNQILSNTYFVSGNWVRFSFDSINKKLIGISTGGTVIPNYSGKLVVHVTTSDSGSVGNTRVQVTNAQLGSYYVQSLDALGSTTFELLDNHVYTVTLIDYPETYYGGSDTVEITGGEVQTLNFEMNTEPDIIGWDYNTYTGEMVYTDGAANWIPASFDADHHIQYHSFADSWLLRGIHSCLYKDGVVQYYLDENDNAKKTDGTDADITSGADGDVMVEFQKIYTKSSTYIDTNNHEHHTIQISKQALSGYYPIGFYNRNNTTSDTTYIAKYNGYKDGNNKIRSLSGSSITSLTFGEVLSYTRNVGESYCGFHNEHLNLLCILFSMIFKTLKFEDIYPNCTYNSCLTNGYGNHDGLFNTNNNNYPKIFGIENMGCTRTCIEGLLQTVKHETDSSGNTITYTVSLDCDVLPYNNFYDVNSTTLSTAHISGVHNFYIGEYVYSPFSAYKIVNGLSSYFMKISLTDAIFYTTSYGHYTTSYYICSIGEDSTFKGIFNQFYGTATNTSNIIGGYYSYDSSYKTELNQTIKFVPRLASIPV